MGKPVTTLLQTDIHHHRILLFLIFKYLHPIYFIKNTNNSGKTNHKVIDITHANPVIVSQIFKGK